MKKTFFTIPVLVLLTVLTIAACKKQVETQPPPTESIAATSTTGVAGNQNPTSVSPIAAADVEALIKEKLQDHHDIDRILGATKTREEWNATLDRMIGYGAKISEEEKQIIIDYLLSR